MSEFLEMQVGFLWWVQAEPEGEVSEGLVDKVPEAYWLLKSDGHE